MLRSPLVFLLTNHRRQSLKGTVQMLDMEIYFFDCAMDAVENYMFLTDSQLV